MELLVTIVLCYHCRKKMVEKLVKSSLGDRPTILMNLVEELKLTLIKIRSHLVDSRQVIEVNEGHGEGEHRLQRNHEMKCAKP